MVTNGDITIYNRKYDTENDCYIWSHKYVPEAWWFKKEQSSITTDGRKNQDVVTVRIPDVMIQVQKDDYIVYGRCEIDVETVKDLDGLEKFRVTSVTYNRYGGNPHVKVVGV